MTRLSLRPVRQLVWERRRTQIMSSVGAGEHSIRRFNPCILVIASSVPTDVEDGYLVSLAPGPAILDTCAEFNATP